MAAVVNTELFVSQVINKLLIAVMDEPLDIEYQSPTIMKNEIDQCIGDMVEHLLAKIVDVVFSDAFPIAESVLHSSETSGETRQDAVPIEDSVTATVGPNHGATPVICITPHGLIATTCSSVKRWTFLLMCGCFHVGEGLIHE